MFFIASKLFAFLLMPSNIILLLIIAGALLALARKRSLGLIIFSASLGLAVAAGWGPLPFWLLTPLENRHPVPSLQEPVTGIILLGGGVDVELQPRENGPVLTHAAGRLLATIALAHRFPAATILISGGSPELRPTDGRSEAAITKDYLSRMGISPDRILAESRSRDTYENAREAARLLRPKPTDHWLLVTSAVHMPRAVGSFEAAQFAVIPYPADYKTDQESSLTRLPESAAQGWYYLDIAAHEWLGLIAYRLSGRISALLP